MRTKYTAVFLKSWLRAYTECETFKQYKCERFKNKMQKIMIVNNFNLKAVALLATFNCQLV